MVCDAGDDVGEPGLGVDIVEIGGLCRRRRPTRRHDAGSLGREVVVAYLFHPLFRKLALVAADQMHLGARHLTLRSEEGESFLVPEWMTQSNAATVKVVDVPCIFFTQLLALRALLDSILTSLAGNAVPSEGGVDGDPLDLATKGSVRNPTAEDAAHRFTGPERRKALDLLQALLAEAMPAPPKGATENRVEASDDEDIA